VSPYNKVEGGYAVSSLRTAL